MGRPSKADLEERKQAQNKQNILYFILAVGIFLLGGIVAQALNADELVHKFGNPSFSGINQSAHYLTIDEQERTRKEKIAQDVQDKLEEAQREAENTVMAKFLRNLQSRIYSTLGNILRWVNNGVTITLTIEEWFDGVLISTTEIVIPIGSFGGCWVDCDGGG